MSAELILTNVGFAVSFGVCLGLGLLAYIKRPSKGYGANIALLLLSLSVCVWQASYAIGINLSDPLQSRLAFMFNLASLIVAISTLHLMLIVTGDIKAKFHRGMLKALYAAATLIIVFFSAFPGQFLSPSKPRLYLPDFFVPGPLYSLQDIFFFLVVVYILAQTVVSYKRSDHRTKDKLKYFVVAIIYGYIVSLSAEFLLYGVSVDPILSSLTGLYTVPLAYAVLRYDMVSLNVAARITLGYVLAIGSVALFISLTGYLNDALIQALPDAPRWLLPVASSVMAVLIGTLAYRKLREADALKYQFMDIVTHKFRTPLTQIKWGMESVRAVDDRKEREQLVDEVSSATKTLFELTDAMTGLSDADYSQSIYDYRPVSLKEMIGKASAPMTKNIRDKGISIDMAVPDGLPDILVDRNKTEFVLQTIVENAVRYSDKGGHVSIGAALKGGKVVLTVKDSGIGMSKDEMRKLFSRFFRSENATKAYTEGLGIGLSLSADIMRRQGGKIWADSEGLGKGSTFYVSFPVAR